MEPLAAAKRLFQPPLNLLPSAVRTSTPVALFPIRETTAPRRIVTSPPAALAKASTIFRMPPTGWNSVVCHS